LKYTPHTPEEVRVMLSSLGLNTVDELFADIPEEVKLNRPLNLPAGMSEIEVKNHLSKLAAKNGSADKYTTFLGAGVYDHYVPSVVNHILLRSEFYTAYTPYQAEMSQGVLQSIFEYQTMICELTGLDITNASMYDGGSALAEAALMAVNQTRRDKVLVLTTVHPEYRSVVKTYTWGPEIEVVEVPQKNGVVDLEKLEQLIDDKTAAVLVQQPNFFGQLEPVEEISRLIHAKKGLMVVAVDPISLGILKPPAEYGADIAVGDGQALGNGLSFGGPHLGFFAARKDLARRMPGRLVGLTTDKNGNRGFVLTLQAREQHIRREKATSNICSNQALNALAATVYLATVGKKGLKEIAYQSLQKAHYAYDRLIGEGYEPLFTGPFFKEFVVKVKDEEALMQKLLKHNIVAGPGLSRFYPEYGQALMIAVTEKRTRAEIDTLVEVMGGDR